MPNFTHNNAGVVMCGPKTENFMQFQNINAHGHIHWASVMKLSGFMGSLIFGELLNFRWIRSRVPALWGFKVRRCVSGAYGEMVLKSM